MRRILCVRRRRARRGSARRQPSLSGQSRPAETPYTTWSDYGGSADSMQYSALTQINKTQRATARAGLVLSGPGSHGQLRLQSARRRRRDVRARPAQRDRRARRGDRKADLGARRRGRQPGQPRHQLLGEQGPIGPAADLRRGRRAARDRRAHRDADHDLRRRRPRRHARRDRSVRSAARAARRDASSRTCSSPARTPAKATARRPAISAPSTSSPASWCGRSTRFRIPGEFGYDTWPEGAYKWAGGVNAWGEISIDEKRGIAYFPLGSPTHDIVRRRSQGRQPVWQLAARARCAHRQAAVALPDGPSRSLGLRPDHRAEAADRPAQRQDGRHRGAGDEVRTALRVRSRDRASRSGRSKSGRCRRATCPARSRWPTQPFPDQARRRSRG